MTYDKHTCEVGHPALRREFIGSSDASAIMGVSPWDTPLTLWETKVGLRPAKDLSFAMARGIELEQEARNYISEKTGIEFHPTRIFSQEYPWMMANLDGISVCEQYSVEIKCPGAADHACAIAGVVPEKYLPQLIHQMIVTGHKIMYYLSYVPNNPVILKVEYDEDYAKKLIKKEMEFKYCLIEFREPEKTDKDYRKKNDASWNNAAQKFISLSTMKKQLDDQVEEARQDLLKLTDGNSCEGCGVKVIKSVRKGSIQYSKIPEIQHIDLDYYRSNPTEVWKILINGDSSDE